MLPVIVLPVIVRLPDFTYTPVAPVISLFSITKVPLPLSWMPLSSGLVTLAFLIVTLEFRQVPLMCRTVLPLAHV